MIEKEKKITRYSCKFVSDSARSGTGVNCSGVRAPRSAQRNYSSPWSESLKYFLLSHPNVKA